MSNFTEAVVEDATLSWLEGLGYAVAHGPELAPDGIKQEWDKYSNVVLLKRPSVVRT